MIVPIWFLLAWLAWSSVELVRDPPLPQDGNHAVPALCLAVALFLLYYGATTSVDLVSRRLGRPDNALLRGLLLLRPVLPLLFYVALLASTRWDAFVRFQVAGPDLFLYSLLCIAPFLLFEALAVLGETLLHGTGEAALGRLKATWLIAPILFLIVGLSALMTLHPWTRAALYELEIARYAAWTAGFLVALTVLPLWFVTLFRTRPVEPGFLREDLEALVKRSGVGLHGIHVLETGGRSLNAAVLGPAALTRRILLTDLLVARFAPRQTRAVCAHELAHAQRHHGLRQVLFFLVLPLVLGGAIVPRLPWSEDTALIVVAASLLVLFLPLFRWLRHRYEHEADLFGARLTGGPGEMISALEEVDRIYPGRTGRSTLLHPSTARRVEFLGRARDVEGYLAAWLRRTFRVQAQLFFLLGLALVASLPRVVGATRAGWPGFLLAAGYPERALDACLALDTASLETARGRRDLDQAGRAMLVAYGVDRGPAGVPVLKSRALRRARDALARKHWAAVHGWYGLARRLGDCGEAIDAMFAYLDAEASHDDVGMSRARALLRSLPLPAEIRRAVGQLPRAGRG